MTYRIFIGKFIFPGLQGRTIMHFWNNKKRNTNWVFMNSYELWILLSNKICFRSSVLILTINKKRGSFLDVVFCISYKIASFQRENQVVSRVCYTLCKNMFYCLWIACFIFFMYRQFCCPHIYKTSILDKLNWITLYKSLFYHIVLIEKSQSYKL